MATGVAAVSSAIGASTLALWGGNGLINNSKDQRDHERFFGGACARGIYDNMKTSLDAIFVGKDRAYNRRFQQMCGHYLVEPMAPQ